MTNIMCPGWSEANKSLRAESPERKDTMSENVYTIPGLISHVTQEVKQSPTQNQLRLAVTFPDRLMLSSNEQIGVFMDFAACIPDTIATSGKAYCKRIMTDVTRNAEKEQFYCVFYIDTVPLQSESCQISVACTSTGLLGLLDPIEKFIDPQHDPVAVELLQRHVVILLERQSLVISAFPAGQKDLKRPADVGNGRKRAAVPVALRIRIHVDSPEAGPQILRDHGIALDEPQKIFSIEAMNLFSIFPVTDFRHIVIDNHDHVSAGIELAVENVIADPAQVALNSWRTFNDSGAGIVVAIGRSFCRINVNAAEGEISQRQNLRAVVGGSTYGNFHRAPPSI